MSTRVLGGRKAVLEVGYPHTASAKGANPSAEGLGYLPQKILKILIRNSSTTGLQSALPIPTIKKFEIRVQVEGYMTSSAPPPFPNHFR